MNNCPSKFTLAQWKTNDLSAKEQRAVGTHVEGCDACREIIGEIEANAAKFEPHAEAQLQSILKNITAKTHVERGEVPSRQPLIMRRVIPVLAAMAAAASVIFALAGPLKTAEHSKPDTAFKGSFSFKVIAKRGGDQFQVSSGDQLRENDAVRFAITTGVKGYISVLSIDDQKRISPFYPEKDPSLEAAPLILEEAGKYELPGSIILDDSTGIEYFVVLFSKEFFDRRQLHDRLRTLMTRKGVPKKIGNVFVGVIEIRKQRKDI